MSNSWRLAIDFGTSNSAAAQQIGGREPQTLPLTHQGNLMPSAVFFTETEAFAGHAAINHASSRPDAYLATPKRAIDHPSIRLGGKDIPTATVFAAVIRQIVEKAKAQHNGTEPDAVVVTHPEAWSSAALKTLIEAARQSGIAIDKLSLISEPRAAAYHYSTKNNLKAGEKVAVFDFGGGTLDVAVLSPSGDGTLQVVAARGDNSLGGRNIDSIIKQWVMDQLDENNTPFHDFLLSPEAGAALHDLDLAVRSAKEVLSDAPSASISISGGGHSESLLLTRQEFERLISADISRAMDLTRATLLDAGLRPDQTTLVYLTGGSARIPYIQDQLGNLAHVATLDDPKTVVCRGALMGPTRPASAILDGNLSQYINPGDKQADSFRGEGGAGAAGFVAGAAAGAGMAGTAAGAYGPGMGGGFATQPNTGTAPMAAAGMGNPAPHTPPGGFNTNPGANQYPNSDQRAAAYSMPGNHNAPHVPSSHSNTGGNGGGLSTGAKAALAVSVVAALAAGGFGISKMVGGGDSGEPSTSASSSAEPGTDSGSSENSAAPQDGGSDNEAAAGSSPLPDEDLKLPRGDKLPADVAKLLPAAFANTVDCFSEDGRSKFFPKDFKEKSVDVKSSYLCNMENESLSNHFKVHKPMLYIYHDKKVVEAALKDLDKKDSLDKHTFNEIPSTNNVVAWSYTYEYTNNKVNEVELFVANKEKDILITFSREFLDDQDENAKAFAANSGLTTKNWG